MLAIFLDAELFRESLIEVIAISLMLLILVTLLELTDFRATWQVTVPLVVWILGSSLLWLTGNLGAGYFLVSSIVLYLFYGAMLPTIARRWARFGGGLTAWLGIGTTKTNRSTILIGGIPGSWSSYSNWVPRSPGSRVLGVNLVFMC